MRSRKVRVRRGTADEVDLIVMITADLAEVGVDMEEGTGRLLLEGTLTIGSGTVDMGIGPTVAEVWIRGRRGIPGRCL